MSVEVELPSSLAVKPPAYLDANLFHEVLEYALTDCTAVKITKISFGSGSVTGDNFLGVIYRVKVHFRRLERICAGEEVVSFIVKLIQDSDANEFLYDLNVFLKEKVCYRDVLPRMTVLSNDGEKFGAKLYHSVRDPLRTFIFEDLTTCNYEMASREAGLDEKHCCAVLRKLGKFHAMSMLLGKKDPAVMHCFHNGLISRLALKDNGLPLQYYGGELAVLEAIMHSWPGFEKIVVKIAKYREDFRENLLRSVAPSEHDIRVLNHGDMWVNNILFQYEESGDEAQRTPVKAIFVDYQMSVWGSLGLDLNYFLHTSVQLKVLQERREHLLRVYYESLHDALQSQQIVDVPSFEQVQQEVRRREGWGFFALFAILPLIALDKEESSDNNLENMSNEDFALRKMQKMFSNPRVQDLLKYGLKRLDEAGVLDV